VSTFAGLAGSTGFGDGAALSATFKNPVGVAVDSAENVYVADTGNNAIRLISGGNVTTIAADNLLGTRISSPAALCVGPNGNVYVSNTGQSDIVLLAALTVPAWAATVFVGTPGTEGYVDTASGLPEFSGPGGIAYDALHNVFYLADTPNNNIRVITTAGVVSTLAGDTSANPVAGSADGNGSAAKFNSPMAITLDANSTYLYVADTNNATVRRIAITTGLVDTLVGNASIQNLQTVTGALPAAAICQGVALDPTGLLLYLTTNDAVLTCPTQ
jgi:DNA-binding beta-propeller fold protein YncE